MKKYIIGLIIVTLLVTAFIYLTPNRFTVHEIKSEIASITSERVNIKNPPYDIYIIKRYKLPNAKVGDSVTIYKWNREFELYTEDPRWF